jgi:Zn finger protein HypA/HybF involved in hydrogenase expression
MRPNVRELKCKCCGQYFPFEEGESLCPECRDFLDLEKDIDEYFIYPSNEEIDE